MDSAGEGAARVPRLEGAAILAEGAFDLYNAKTAVGILRYGSFGASCVIDSTHRGKLTSEVVGVGDVPVVGSLRVAVEHGAPSLILGTVGRGGFLPDEWRPVILDALHRGMDVLSGLHTFLGLDEELAEAAAQSGSVIWDVRRPPADLQLPTWDLAARPPNVVLTIGTDCNVGKMTVSLELQRAARADGFQTDFAATGQTGIMIRGRGIAVDACIADYISGAAERLVMEAGELADWVFVEGQGSLFHPAYSGVTHGLITGTAPRWMILCHQPDRPHLRGYPHIEVPSLVEALEHYVRTFEPLFASTICGIALNTASMTPDEAAEAIGEAERATGLPADDCVRNGGGKLWKHLRATASA